MPNPNVPHKVTPHEVPHQMLYDAHIMCHLMWYPMIRWRLACPGVDALHTLMQVANFITHKLCVHAYAIRIDGMQIGQLGVCRCHSSTACGVGMYA